MLLDEYDYETDIEVQREEAREEGRKQGTLQKTCALIQKKLEKGKTISEIADDLEDTEENIVHLIEEFHLIWKERILIKLAEKGRRSENSPNWNTGS